MIDIYDSETIIKCYSLLSRKCDIIDKFINNQALYFGPCTAEYGAEDVYNNIIERGKTRGCDKKKLKDYYEAHHIIPKCMGGADSKDNLVLLTAKEHFICHLLLEKMYPNEKGLALAAYRLIYGNEEFRKEIRVTSKTISDVKQRAIEAIRKYGRERQHKDEERKIISQKAKERWKKFVDSGRIEDIKKNISESTKKSMMNPEIIEKTRINKGSKWYTNIITNESMHWYQGMDTPDQNIWRPGRPKMSSKTKEKIKKIQENIGYYYNDNLKENRRFNTEEPIPDGWVKGRKKEYFGNGKINRKKKREKELYISYISEQLEDGITLS
jgi:hypothetical protein